MFQFKLKLYKSSPSVTVNKRDESFVRTKKLCKTGAEV